jgi:hypothetical protein
MIAGGAAYRYWALKSPVPIRAREPEKGSTVLTREPFRPAGINPYLIDSPDFIGLSALSRWGLFLEAAAGVSRPNSQRADAVSCSATPRWPSAVMWMPSAWRKPLRSAITYGDGIDYRLAIPANCLPL